MATLRDGRSTDAPVGGRPSPGIGGVQFENALRPRSSRRVPNPEPRWFDIAEFDLRHERFVHTRGSGKDWGRLRYSSVSGAYRSVTVLRRVVSEEGNGYLAVLEKIFGLAGIVRSCSGRGRRSARANPKRGAVERRTSRFWRLPAGWSSRPERCGGPYPHGSREPVGRFSSSTEFARSEVMNHYPRYRIRSGGVGSCPPSLLRRRLRP